MNWLYELAVCHAVECQRGHCISLDDAKSVNVPMTSNLLSILGASCPAGIIEMLADQDDKRECIEPGIQFL
jgi:hypothetical protein